MGNRRETCVWGTAGSITSLTDKDMYGKGDFFGSSGRKGCWEEME